MNNSLSSERKMERLNCFAPPELIISDRKYNLILGGTILYGLLVNVLMCQYVSGAAIIMALGPIMTIVAYVACIIIGTAITVKSKNPWGSFLGYNLIVLPLGVFISALVAAYGGISSQVVSTAFMYTAVITLVMVAASTAFPRFFARLGGFLFTALIGLVVISVLSIFIRSLYGGYLIFGSALFSLYIGYDMYRSQVYPKTADNAVDCAVDIYLDIVNLFVFILQMVGSRDN